mmetsp:Transcript_5557/g.3927  ORF Transcript_5557/g.3927 Transcript_5557/m.3927 type:complete len:85 (+) Transcript_5557:324-578(+)
MMLVGSLGLITISALRFTLVESETFHDVVLNIYYMIIGIVLALSQMNIKRIRKNFRLLNYYWGRGIFCFFLASISFSESVEVYL